MADNQRSGSTAPIQIVVDVGLEGGASIKSGSGELIRNALDKVMTEISQKDYKIKIKPVINKDEIEDQLNNQLGKGIKLNVGANVTLNDVKKGSKDSSSGKSANSDNSKNSTTNNISNDPEYEKMMTKALKETETSFKNIITQKIKNALSEFEKAESDFYKTYSGSDDVDTVRESTDSIQELINSVYQTINNIPKEAKMSDSGSNQYDAGFLNDRNARFESSDAVASFNRIISDFLNDINEISGNYGEESNADQLLDTVDQFHDSLGFVVKEINSNFGLKLHSKEFPLNEKKTSKTKPTEPETKPTGNANNAAPLIADSTVKAIDNIDKNIKQILTSISDKPKKSSDKPKADNVPVGVQISDESINALKDAISNISVAAPAVQNVSQEQAKDYSDILGKILSAISAKAAETNLPVESAPQNSDAIAQLGEAIKSSGLIEALGNLSPTLSADFEDRLTSNLANAIYNAMLMATGEGGGIKEAIQSAINNLPETHIREDDIRNITAAIENIHINSSPYVENKIEMPPQIDYTEKLERIAENTAPREDISSEILSELPDKVTAVLTEALKGIGVTQVNSGDDVSGVGRGLLSPEKALEALLNERVELTKRKYGEKKARLNRGMTEGELADSRRREAEYDRRIAEINEKAKNKEYKNAEFSPALFSSAKELEAGIKAEYAAAEQFAKQQDNAYKKLEENEKKLFEARQQMIDNAFSNQKVGGKKAEDIQSRIDNLNKQINDNNLYNDSMSADLKSRIDSYTDALSKYLIHKYEEAAKQISDAEIAIGKAQFEKKGTKENTSRVESLKTRQSNLRGLADSLGIDSPELQARLDGINSSFKTKSQNNIKQFTEDKIAKQKTEFEREQSKYYSQLKELLKQNSENLKAIYKSYDSGDVDTANDKLIKAQNSIDNKINSIRTKISDNGYSSDSLDKELQSYEEKLNAESDKFGKELLSKRIKEALNIQKEINRRNLKNMDTPDSSEEAAHNRELLKQYNQDISRLNNIIKGFGGSYGGEVQEYTDEQNRLTKAFDSSKVRIEERNKAYDELRKKTLAVVEAEKKLDKLISGGNKNDIDNAQSEVDKLKAERTAYLNDNIRAKNLTNNRREAELSNFERDEQFKRAKTMIKDLYSLQIQYVKDSVNGTPTDYKEREKQIQSYKEQYTKLRAELNESSSGDDGRFHILKGEEDALKKALALENGRVSALQTINKWVTKNRRASDEYKTDIDEITVKIQEALNDETIESLKDQFERIQAAATSRGLTGRDETKLEADTNMASAKSLMQRYQDLLAKADARAFRDYDQKINSTRQTIEAAMSSGTKDSLKEARRQLSELTSDFKTAGYAGGNLFTSLDKKIRGLFQLFVGGSIIGQIKQQFTDAYHSVMNLDNAFANIRMTMEASNEEMHELAQESINLSKELGVSLESVTAAAQIYANQNITTEEIIARSKPTALLASAADMSSSAAADVIQGSLYQFELEDSVENLNRIVDVVEKISASTGVEFKRSIEQISEGIQTTGAMAHEAGFSLEEYAAQVGSLVEKTRRSGSEVANGLKMIYARLGQNREGDATEEEISKAETAYKSIGINLRDGADTFRDLPDVFAELSVQWDKLTDVQKAYIAEVSAGNRNRSLFMAMMNRYDTTQSLTNDAMNSEGFAEQANEERMKSFEAKIGKIKAAAEGFWNNFINTDIIKTGLDLAAGLIEILDQIINKIPVLSQLVKGLMIAFTVKAIPNFVKEMKQSDSAIGAAIRSIQQIIPNVKEFRQAFESFKNINANSSIDEIAMAFDGAGSDETKTALAKYLGITDEQIEAARNRLAETVEKISSEADSGDSDADDNDSDSDDGGLGGRMEAVQEQGEQVAGVYENISNAIHETREAQETAADTTSETVSALGAETASVEMLNNTETQQAAVSATNVTAEQNEAAVRTAATGTINAENAATAGLNATETVNTAVTTANIGATAANTAGNAANAASQLSLGKAIGVVTKKLLAQAAAWAATPAGIATIALTAIMGISSLVGAINQSAEESRKEIEETRKAAAEATAEYHKTVNELADTEKKVTSLYGKYKTLSKGVSENGYRISLTRDQYEEYKSVVSEIAQLAPSLVESYNAEGLALLNLGENVDELRGKYKKLNKEKAQTFVDENSDTIISDLKNVFNKYSSDHYDVTEYTAVASEIYDAISKYNKGDSKELERIISNYSPNNPIDRNAIIKDIALRFGADPYARIDEENLTQHIDMEGLSELINTNQEQIDGAKDRVNELITSELQTKTEFYALSNTQKPLIDEIMNALNTGSGDIYNKLANEKTTTGKLASIIMDTVTNENIEQISNSKKILDEQYKNGEIFFGEYQDSVHKLEDCAREIAGDSEFSDVVVGMFNTEEETERRIKAIRELSEQAVKQIISFGNGALDKFTTEDIEIIAHLDVSPEWSEEDLRNEIADEKLRMRNLALSEFNFLDSGYKTDIDTFTSSMGKLKSAMKSISTMTSEDLLELMMAFSSFDWASFGVTGEAGVGDVEGAIRALIDKTLADLKSAFGDIDGAQMDVFNDMAENAKDAAKEIKGVSDAMNGLKSMYDTLKSVQEDVSKYGRIGIDTVADLIDEYPELADEGALYVSGVISVEEFMAAFRESYDKASEEKEQYIYKKALEDEGTRAAYIQHISKVMGEDEGKAVAAALSSYEESVVSQTKSYDLWRNLYDKYEIDLDKYSSYAEARHDIDNQLSSSLDELKSSFADYYDEETASVDVSKMRSDGINDSGISYALGLAANVREARELLPQIRAYYNSSFAIDKQLVDQAGYLYDVDISNCKSYAVAKAKIYEKILTLGSGILDDVESGTDKIEILQDLIDKDTGIFDEDKARNVYKWGDDAVAEGINLAEGYRKIAEAEKEINGVVNGTGFLGEINSETPAEEAEKYNNILTEMISLYDEIFNGIQAVADKRIETLEKEKEALEEKNEEESKEIELIKARQQLEDAKRNKNIRVYHEGEGFVWEADRKVIKEAEENLKDKETDAQTDAIDKQIEALNKYKDSISEITDEIETEKSISAAMKYLGVSDPDKLLKMSEGTMQSLQDNYRALSLANDRQDNSDNLEKYSIMTDEQIRERFGSNFGMSIESLKDYWNGNYFIPDTIKEYIDTEKKTMQALAKADSAAASGKESKNYYIENINITYSGSDINELIQSAVRQSAVTNP